MTVAKAYRLLKAILITAVEDELIARNLCRLRHAGVERTPERKPPSIDEVERIAGAIEPRWATRAAAVRDYHFHDLRHLAATLAAVSGATTRELMHRMGHSSSRAALIYQHATADRDLAIAEAMSRIVEPQQFPPWPLAADR